MLAIEARGRGDRVLLRRGAKDEGGEEEGRLGTRGSAVLTEGVGHALTHAMSVLVCLH